MYETTVSLQQILDDTARWLNAGGFDLPQMLSVGTNALVNANDTTLTLVGNAEVGDYLEFPGGEVAAVVAKSTDADPVYTLSRGLVGTPNVGAVPTNTSVARNPQFWRWEMRRHVLDWFNKAPALLPLSRVMEITTAPPDPVVELPSETIDVGAVETWDGQRYRRVGGWRILHNVPSSVSSTTVALRLPASLVTWPSTPGRSILVTYHVRYQWTPGGKVPTSESSTVSMNIGSEACPSLFAAAMLASGREYSRLQLDRAEEWFNEESVRSGANLRITTLLWQHYYRALDDARKVLRLDRHRPWTPMR
jgi:hypothetical protein